MKKVLFILQKKHYTSQLMSYIKTLKLIGYEIHIFTDMEDEFEYCDKQQKCNFNILRLENYTRKIKDYYMVLCNSKMIEIIIKLVNIKEKDRIIYINSKININKGGENNYCIENYIKEGKYIFCSIGEFNKNNNQIMQLEAMIRIIKRYPQAKLLLVGQGKLKEYYEHIIEKFELNENVEIIENAISKIDIVQKANCIISTRKKEEFALDSLIAIILNKPILAFDIGINKYILKKENIFYNSENLKDKMKKYIEENRNFERYYDISLKEREKILESNII